MKLHGLYLAATISAVLAFVSGFSVLAIRSPIEWTNREYILDVHAAEPEPLHPMVGIPIDPPAGLSSEMELKVLLNEQTIILENVDRDVRDMAREYELRNANIEGGM